MVRQRTPKNPQKQLREWVGRIPYRYFIEDISENADEPAFKATIPALNNGVVFGENLKEVEKGIRTAIAAETENRKKRGESMPKADAGVKASGRILVRISPMLHEKLLFEAEAHEVSLNQYIANKLEKTV